MDLVFLHGPPEAGKLVRLDVSASEQERRIGMDSRSEFHKLTSVDTLRRLRDDPRGVEHPPVDLAIDTDRVDPAAAAGSIVDRFRLEPRSRDPRYPD